MPVRRQTGNYWTDRANYFADLNALPHKEPTATVYHVASTDNVPLIKAGQVLLPGGTGGFRHPQANRNYTYVWATKEAAEIWKEFMDYEGVPHEILKIDLPLLPFPLQPDGHIDVGPQAYVYPGPLHGRFEVV